ncbi:hypothetical protein B484DRAFT_396149 [Ochromonadaceae sp. CCMP2298]|nr:hypothetical protein B484DRAFT_397276 [Ochromonadaceae sp. CCMP2298]KAJ1429904.1 hypothetical protein B484DRAFT_396149 [Ochromonadaceae sp. CCMP2298]
MQGRQAAATVRKLVAAGKELLDLALDALAALARCVDFKTETTALQELLESRGHILVTSVKCHPELAGCGIEYSWGKSKLEFRKKNNCTGKKRCNLKDRVASSLDIGSVLPLERIWKFERRTRDYKNVYIKLEVAIGVKFRDLHAHAFSPVELTWLCAEMDNQNEQWEHQRVSAGFKTGVPFVEAEVCSESIIDGISVRRLEAQFGTGESDLRDIDASLLVEIEKTSGRRAAKGGALPGQV